VSTLSYFVCRENILLIRNRDTRIRKLDDPNGEFSALILASAGLIRLGLEHRISSRLDSAKFPYAVGQGALGIEVRKGDTRILELLGNIEHVETRWVCLAERSLLRQLQGGCSSPVGVSSSIFEEERVGGKRKIIKLEAIVVHPDGLKDVQASFVMEVGCDEDAEDLGKRVAGILVDEGAGEILEGIRAAGQARRGTDF
jgi:hydroxymethylbilane synthase